MLMDFTLDKKEKLGNQTPLLGMNIFEIIISTAG